MKFKTWQIFSAVTIFSMGMVLLNIIIRTMAIMCLWNLIVIGTLHHPYDFTTWDAFKVLLGFWMVTFGIKVEMKK